MKRLAIILTHPIQYNAPAFRLLAQSGKVLIKVFYTWEQSRSGEKFDPGFGKNIEWDIPLLEGYDYTFVRNTASDPGPHHFFGLVNPSLNQEVADWKPDAVLIYGWNYKSHLGCMRYFQGKVPVLFRGDSTLIDERPGIKKWIRRTFLKWVYGHVDYALYVGANNKSYFQKHGLTEEQLFFVPHAIDNDRFAEPDEYYCEQAIEWKHKLGISEDDIVILYAGKLELKKNPFFLIDLAKSLVSRKIKFLIVGNGVLEKQLKKAAATDPRILFLDFQNQKTMPSIYRIGSVFILPSTGPGETWGLAVNEAMASGKPVIVSDKAGCAVDLVPANDNGIIMDAGNIAACVQLISVLLEDRNRLSAMGENSRRIIRDYSLQKIVDSINILLEEIK